MTIDLHSRTPQRVRAGVRRARPVVRRVYRALAHAVGRVLFERGGPDTGRWVELRELDLDGPERNRYEPSGWWYLRRALRGTRVGPDDVFIDFGSGMGRVVVQAARLPFKRVVGVELAEPLTEIARKNVAGSRPRLRAREVELVTADVARYEMPDDLTIAYVHNSFVGEPFRRFLQNLVASVDRAPRTVRFIYANPVLHDEVVGTGRFTLVRQSKGLRPDVRSRRINVYEVRPRPQTAGAAS